MILSLEKLAQHNVRCIVLPKEKLDQPVSDYTVLEYRGQKFEILSNIRFSKSDQIPTIMKLLAIGEDISDENIWKAYTNSDNIYFFIVKEK